jgi:N-acetylglucosaminyldiphosphoundecaprenol N-acetyl-beta-D-mannosaminyltransferase
MNVDNSMLENRVKSRRYPVVDWNADVCSMSASDIVSIFGVRIANLTSAQGFDAVIRLMERHSAALRSDPVEVGAATLFFCNANTLNFVYSDPAYRAMFNTADLIFGDGTGVRVAAFMRGTRMKANLNGTDLVPEFLRSRERRGERVFILGGEEAANRTAAEHFQAHYPGLTFAGRHHGFLVEAESTDLVRMINDAQPDILLVGMGHPRQEQWISAHAGMLRVPLIIAVGGLFAYWGNGLKRASSFARRIGFEWFEIMLQQPQKVRRYMVGGLVFLSRAVATVPRDLQIMRGGARS